MKSYFSCYKGFQQYQKSNQIQLQKYKKNNKQKLKKQKKNKIKTCA